MLDSRRRLGSPVRPELRWAFRHSRSAFATVGHRRRPRSHERRRRQHPRAEGPQSSDPVRAAQTPAVAPSGRPPAQAQGPQAAVVLDPLRPRGPRRRVDDLRDDDGRRLRPAPDREPAEYKHLGANSYLYDDHWRKIGVLQPPNNEVIDTFPRLGPYMRKAIVAVEDKRFWSDPGVDIKGIARAFVADVTGGARQGASTIAQQFVKNALAAEGNRTVFEKLREAALAYHLTRKWPRTQILDEYLNSIYFGNGAYGAEFAARVYFGKALHYARPPPVSEARRLRRLSAALLLLTAQPGPGRAAGRDGGQPERVQPTPAETRHAAWVRRDLVLKDMLGIGRITGPSTASTATRRCRPRTTSSSPRSRRRRRTSPAGSAPRWSPRWSAATSHRASRVTAPTTVA